MGLDMYLSEKVYLSHYESLKETNDKYAEEYKKADQIMKLVGLKSEVDGGVYVSATVMYWRKANQIHRWFVENVQNNVDDCGTYYLEADKLIELRDLCQKVLDSIELVPDVVIVGRHVVNGGWENITEPGKVVANPKVCEELLPVQGGFFFGGTSYDQWYVGDLQETVDGLNKVLANAGEYAEFEYHSSW